MSTGSTRPVTDFSLRYHPALPIRSLGSPLVHQYLSSYPDDIPASNRRMIQQLCCSFTEGGMRNPLTVEWFDPWDDNDSSPNKTWSIRIGNQRAVAALMLGWEEVPALIIAPREIEVLEGCRPISPDSALALFDASHPWWHSYLLRKYHPNLIPRCA